MTAKDLSSVNNNVIEMKDVVDVEEKSVIDLGMNPPEQVGTFEYTGDILVSNLKNAPRIIYINATSMAEILPGIGNVVFDRMRYGDDQIYDKYLVVVSRINVAFTSMSIGDAVVVSITAVSQGQMLRTNYEDLMSSTVNKKTVLDFAQEKNVRVLSRKYSAQSLYGNQFEREDAHSGSCGENMTNPETMMYWAIALKSYYGIDGIEKLCMVRYTITNTVRFFNLNIPKSNKTLINYSNYHLLAKAIGNILDPNCRLWRGAMIKPDVVHSSYTLPCRAVSDMREYINRVKALLINTYSHKTLLDLGTGRGNDLIRWDQSTLNSVMCLDKSNRRLKELRRKYRSFQCSKLKKLQLETNRMDLRSCPQNLGRQYDSVSCMFVIQFLFDS